VDSRSPYSGVPREKPPAEWKHGRSELFDMKFIEMTGGVLKRLVSQDELHAGDLESTGVQDDTIVRINRQGDIEVRRADRWDVIGGLLGNYEQRLKAETGLDWAE
jgi:hypothetical protein